jgi:hypothetical protein
MKNLRPALLVATGILLIACTTVVAPNVLLADPGGPPTPVLLGCTPGNCDSGTCGANPPPCGNNTQSCKFGSHPDCQQPDCQCRKIGDTLSCNCNDINNP